MRTCTGLRQAGSSEGLAFGWHRSGDTEPSSLRGDGVIQLSKPRVAQGSFKKKHFACDEA